MKHKIPLKEFLENPSIQMSPNMGLQMYISDKFFPVGNNKLISLFNDFSRTVRANSIPYLGLIDPNDPNFNNKYQAIKEQYSSDIDAQKLKDVIQTKLNNIYGEDVANRVIAGHSQTAVGFIKAIVAESVLSHDQIQIPLPEPRDWIVDVIQDKKDKNDVKMRIYIEKFPIKDLETQEVIGYIPGPVEALLQLKQKNNNEWGYELIQVETNNNDIASMMRGKMFKASEIKLKYAPEDVLKRYNKTIQVLEKTCDNYLQELTSSMKKMPDEAHRTDIDEQIITFMKALNNKIDKLKSEYGNPATDVKTSEKLVKQLNILMTLKANIELHNLKQHHDPDPTKYYLWLAQRFAILLAGQESPIEVPKELINALKEEEKNSTLYSLKSDLKNKIRAANKLNSILNDPIDEYSIILGKAEKFISENKHLFESNDKPTAKFSSAIEKAFSPFQNAGAGSSLWSTMFASNSPRQPASSAPTNDNAIQGPRSNQNDSAPPKKHSQG